MKTTPLSINEDGPESDTEADDSLPLGEPEDLDQDVNELEYIKNVSGTERLADSLHATIEDFRKTEEEAGRPFSHYDTLGAVTALHVKVKRAFTAALISEEQDLEDFGLADPNDGPNDSDDGDEDLLSTMSSDDDEEEEADDDATADDEEQEIEH